MTAENAQAASWNLFSESDIRRICERADIVRIIDEYIVLNQKGRLYWACCPFHDEATPSFKVDPDEKKWHCFGCATGGNVIDFVQRIEGVSYPQAVNMLAKRLGTALTSSGDQPSPDEPEVAAGNSEQLSRMEGELEQAVGILQNLQDDIRHLKSLQSLSTADDGAESAADNGAKNPQQGAVVQPEQQRSRLTEKQRERFIARGRVKRIEEVLKAFDLPARVISMKIGRSFTEYRVRPEDGVRLAKLLQLADDIARCLGVEAVRIARVPGTPFVGIEIPNQFDEFVPFKEALGACEGGPLQFSIGEDVGGNKVCIDLAEAHHLLVAGLEGSARTVCLCNMIATIFSRTTPDEVRMILIAPRAYQLRQFSGAPHLYVPPVTDLAEIESALGWAVSEMERRIDVFDKSGICDIDSHSDIGADGRACERMPSLVIVIEELSHLMLGGKNCEGFIGRIAQLGHRVGIHLIVGTSRATCNVFTSATKANITNRIALQSSVSVVSRVILGQAGAETLGSRDLLYSTSERSTPKRLTGVWVDDEEIDEAVERSKSLGDLDYHYEILK